MRARARRWYRSNGPAGHDRHPHLRRPGADDRAVQERSRGPRAGGRCGSWSSTTAARPTHSERLAKARARAEVVLDSENAGFASQRQPRARAGRSSEGSGDVVLLNNDVIAQRGLARDACSTRPTDSETRGIVGAKLLYPDGRIQSAGSYRNLGAPEWFDHRYRFRPSDHGPAERAAPVLAVDRRVHVRQARGARRDRRARRGLRHGLRGHRLLPARAGRRAAASLYSPARRARPTSSRRRAGTVQGERELASQRRFWERWGDWFDQRDVRTRATAAADRLRDRGHRRRRRPPRHLRAPQPAAERGHDVALYSLGDAARTGSTSACRSRTFEDYDELVDGARRRSRRSRSRPGGTPREPVWLASVHARDPRLLRPGHRDVLLPGRPPAAGRRARELPRGVPLHDDLGLEPGAPARAGPRRRADPARHRPRAPSGRWTTCDAATTCCSRSAARNPLKNLPLTVDGWRALGPSRGPSCACSASSPSSGPKYGARYFERPERRGGERALQPRRPCSSRPRAHEGFCLPPLEAMATGARGRLHRRPRQPRLLRRRRQLPDARADGRVGQRRRSRGLSAIRRCASASAERGLRDRRRLRAGSGASTSSSASSPCSPNSPVSRSSPATATTRAGQRRRPRRRPRSGPVPAVAGQWHERGHGESLVGTRRVPVAPLPLRDARADGDRVQAALLRLGAGLPVDAAAPADAVRRAVRGVHAHRPLRRGVPHYPVVLLAAIVVFNFFSEATSGGARQPRRAREPAAQGLLPACRRADLRVADGRREPRARARRRARFALIDGVTPGADLARSSCAASPASSCSRPRLAVLLSVLFVRYRDVQPIWEVALQLLFWGTPIIYTIESVPDSATLRSW